MDKHKIQWQERGKGHRARLRDRFTESGLDGFSDAEVIELLLTFGTPRADCKLQARDLLSELGSFAAVLEASPKDLQKVKGVGPKNSFAIGFIHSVAARYLKVSLKGKQYLRSSTDVIDYLTYEMRGLKREVLTMVFLDSSHAIIDSEIVAEGSLNVNSIYPRELVALALNKHAAAIIIAHNHPSGELLPSPQDMKLTRLLHHIFQTMQIKLLDHIIIGNGSYSFADNSLMKDIEENSKKLSHLISKS